MIQIEDPNEVYNWDCEHLWSVVSSLKFEEGSIIDEEEFKKVKFGIKMEFPIWYLANEWYEIYPVSKKVTVQGFGKYQMKDFMDELEQRNAIMRKIILENITDESPTKPR